MAFACVQPVYEKDIEKVSQLAKEIWLQHYTGILQSSQIFYMIENFQSEKAIKQQIAEGYQYYFLLYNNHPEGYMAIAAQPEKIFLSKLYLRQAARGKGLAKQAMLYLEQQCRQQDKKSIWLTVNKNNISSIEAYKKMEFQIISAQQQDIGNGFVMDDYIMEKIVACK